MRLAAYSPADFETLRPSAEQAGRRALLHRPFVDHYYASGHGRLHLALSDEGAVLGALGVEPMRFLWRGRPMRLGFGSNFYALQPGVGGYLYLQWIRSCDAGLVFGGSEHSHRIFRERRWSYFSVSSYCLNPPYADRPGESGWRRAARRVMRRLIRAPIPRYARRLPPEAWEAVAVREEHGYDQDLVPESSPFSFRFLPSLPELEWRYGLALSFVRYRLFRILARGRRSGYVVLEDAPDRVIVSHCDGSDARLLAWGVLQALLLACREDTRPRSVLLASSHPEMRRLYEAFGFRPLPERPLALGPTRPAVELPSDPEGWLVNYDWGDNGLRPPFRDQEGLVEAGQVEEE